MATKDKSTAHRQLTRKWRETDLMNHYVRLSQTRPEVQSHNSRTQFPHLTVKPKKIQLEEGKSFILLDLNICGCYLLQREQHKSKRIT